MAKKKKEAVFRQRLVTFWCWLIFSLLIVGGVGSWFALSEKPPPRPFLIALGSGIGGAIHAASVCFFPRRLVLKKKSIVLYGVGNRLIGQIPYDNIADVRLHYAGEKGDIEYAGIDLIKRSEDTWWPRGLPFFYPRIYDVEIRDQFDKPPNVIVYLIKARQREFFEMAAQGD